MEYNELNVWIKNRELTNAIYAITKNFRPMNYMGLLTRCGVLQFHCIQYAEGCGRNHRNDSIHFFYIARGSLYELKLSVIFL